MRRRGERDVAADRDVGWSAVARLRRTRRRGRHHGRSAAPVIPRGIDSNRSGPALAFDTDTSSPAFFTKRLRPRLPSGPPPRSITAVPILLSAGYVTVTTAIGVAPAGAVKSDSDEFSTSTLSVSRLLAFRMAAVVAWFVFERDE